MIPWSAPPSLKPLPRLWGSHQEMKTIKVVFTLFRRYVMLTHRLNLIIHKQQMAADIWRGHMQLSIYQTGLIYAILKESHAIADLCRADWVMMADIHTCLEETFALTAEHKVSPPFLCLLYSYWVLSLKAEYLSCCQGVGTWSQLGALYYIECWCWGKHPSLRSSYLMQTSSQKSHLDQDLWEAKGAPLYKYLWQPSSSTTSQLHNTSYLLKCANSYQEMVSANLISYTITDTDQWLHDSIISPNTSTLNDFVIHVSNQFFATQVSLGHPFIVHIALLVCV